MDRKESTTNKTIMNFVNQTISSIYNEPSVGLFYTQQHIHNSFPVLLLNMDKLAENNKKLEILNNNLDQTQREINEIISLNEDFSFKMLTQLSAISYSISKK